MAIRRPQATFDAAARDSTGRLNLDQQQAFINLDSRTRVIERALGIGGLDPDKQAKVAVIPPRADVAIVPSESGGGFTVSLTNPEFIPGRGNPLRNPIYHRIHYGPDPTFRNVVHKLPPGVQTHWPIQTAKGQKFYAQVSQSYDGLNWNVPITKGPFTT